MNRGAEVIYHDAFAPELAELGLRSVALDEGLATADLAAIVTAHPEIDYAGVVERAPLKIDFRGVTREISSPKLTRL